MAKLSLICIVLLAALGCAVSQITNLKSIQDIVETEVHEKCRSSVRGLVPDCGAELLAGAQYMGIDFPPKEGQTLDPLKVKEWADTNPAVSRKCCVAACQLAKLGCGCDSKTYEALKKIGGNIDFIEKSLKQVQYSCAALEAPVPFTTTLRGLPRDTDGADSCSSDPGNVCPSA